ncbi:MAG: hypothetical protein WCP09_03480 [Candidatus Taylorbacteria bacterium]
MGDNAPVNNCQIYPGRRFNTGSVSFCILEPNGPDTWLVRQSVTGYVVSRPKEIVMPTQKILTLIEERQGENDFHRMETVGTVTGESSRRPNHQNGRNPLKFKAVLPHQNVIPT